ncbi:MAG: haloacid dehalogenase type II [Pontibacterium sp.]
MAMTPTLAFDVYGTLIDTHGVVGKLEVLLGNADQARAFSQTWRDKQLEYSFRRGLMKNYKNFAVCTRDALSYTCAFYQINFSREQQDELLAIYRTLPAFPDVKESLSRLSAEGCLLFAFSNGSAEAVDKLLITAGIRGYFQDVISTDEILSFKPNPEVYKHFLHRSHSNKENAWLISSNAFDVTGALSYGMRAAWVQRSADAVFDPWGMEPTITVTSLNEL